VIEASSGSTAVSEAYFARMLNLPFIAVMPRSTSPESKGSHQAKVCAHGLNSTTAWQTPPITLASDSVYNHATLTQPQHPIS